jgi:DNA polymerase III delta subunit
MPSLRLIVASGTGQRRLLEETTAELKKQGYETAARQEGGEWVPLLSENMSGGLFDEKRLVIVDAAALLGPMPESLGSMVEKESSVVIVLVYDSEPTKLIPKSILSKCKVLRPAEFPRWPRERQMWVANLAKEMKVDLSRDAAALIVELLEDPEEIRGQLKSLSLLRRGGTVSAEDVDSLCLDDGSRSLLRLLDGSCSGDAVTVIKALHAIMKNGDLIPLTSALHNRMRLAWYAAMFPRQAALFAKALGARDYAWRLAGQAAKRYGAAKLTRFTIGLVKLNIAEKSGNSAGWNGLETLLLDLMAARR